MNKSHYNLLVCLYEPTINMSLVAVIEELYFPSVFNLENNSWDVGTLQPEVMEMHAHRLAGRPRTASPHTAHGGGFISRPVSFLSGF